MSTIPICAVESYRVAGVEDSNSRVGLLKTGGRAGDELAEAPKLYGMSD